MTRVVMRRKAMGEKVNRWSYDGHEGDGELSLNSAYDGDYMLYSDHDRIHADDQRHIGELEGVLRKLKNNMQRRMYLTTGQEELEGLISLIDAALSGSSPALHVWGRVTKESVAPDGARAIEGMEWTGASLSSSSPAIEPPFVGNMYSHTAHRDQTEALAQPLAAIEPSMREEVRAQIIALWQDADSIDECADKIIALLTRLRDSGDVKVEHDPNRCAVCGWPLDPPNHCGRGDCSMRQFPDHLYDPERAEREYGKWASHLPGYAERHPTHHTSGDGGGK